MSINIGAVQPCVQKFCGAGARNVWEPLGGRKRRLARNFEFGQVRSRRAR